jgi:hypothetical protein
MRQIKLTQNKVAFVDADIYKLLEDVPFHAMKVKERFYARSNRTLLEGKPNTYLHWIVLQPPFHKSFQIHFKDGNTLNCQRANLEYIERSANTQNNSKRQKQRKKSSKYLGVSKDCDIKTIRTKRWSAIIKHEGKIYRLGRYLTEEDAAEVYNKKAIELFGSSAKINKLKGAISKQTNNSNSQ